MSIETLRPNGVGNSTQFTIGGDTPAATNWGSVDEAVSDEDVTDVYADNAWKRDLYNIQDSALQVGATINFVKLYSRMKRYSPNRADLKQGIRSGGTELWHLCSGLKADWTTWERTYYTDPNTGVAWTVPALNALQIGVEAWISGYGGRLTQTYVEVDYTAGVTHEAAAILSGVGTLATIGRGIFTGVATFTGTGTLSAIGSFAAVIHYAKAILSGIGTLSVIGRGIFTSKATLTGTGTLSAIGSLAVRLLRAVVVISQYRGTLVVTSQSRLVRALTSMYRRVKAFTSGG